MTVQKLWINTDQSENITEISVFQAGRGNAEKTLVMSKASLCSALKRSMRFFLAPIIFTLLCSGKFSAQMPVGGPNGSPQSTTCKNLPDSPCHPGDHLKLLVDVAWNPRPPEKTSFTFSTSLELTTRRKREQSGFQTSFSNPLMYGVQTAEIRGPGSYMLDLIIPANVASGTYAFSSLVIRASFDGGSLESGSDGSSAALYNLFVYIDNPATTQPQVHNDHILSVTVLR